MDLIDTLHGIVQDSMGAYGLTDLTVGTVTKASPLEIKIQETMAVLPQEVLWLTSAVIEKKIPILEHEHITAGFRHSHTVSGLGHGHGITELGHSHSTEEGATGEALGGSYQTGQGLGGDYPASDGLTQDAFISDKRLDDIACLEDGKKLPVRDGYIILNRGLEAGDKVLLMRVMRGQQFVVLSRIFERRGANANIAAIRNRSDAGRRIPGPAVPDLDGGPCDPPDPGTGG